MCQGIQCVVQRPWGQNMFGPLVSTDTIEVNMSQI
jgi:hypothetical protein